MDEMTKCVFCNSEAEEKLWESKDNKPTCYAHCSKSTDGAHIADARTFELSESDPTIVDVWCRNCRQSGSFGLTVKAEDINWE